MADLVVRNALLAADTAPVDLVIDAGRIASVAAAGVGSAGSVGSAEVVEAGGRLVVPGLIDSHIHLDVALSGDPSRPGRPEAFTQVKALNDAVEVRRRAFTHEDIVARVVETVRMGLRHGTTALRTQVHVDTEVGLSHLEAVLDARERLGDLVRLQIVAFPQQGLLRNPGTLELFRAALSLADDIVMGGAPNFDPDVTAAEHIDAAFALAVAHGRALDFHADMGLVDVGTVVPLERLETVHIARRALEQGLVGRVAVGHVATLGCCAPEVSAQAIELFARAGLTIISQPDLYRLGRLDTAHVRRGLTRVKELLVGGVNVSFSSNNVRDAFRPVGSVDLIQEALILSYGAHLDSVAELDQLMTMCTTNAARGLGLVDYGLAVGDRADLVVLDATSPSAAIVDQAERLHVITAGQLRVSTQSHTTWIE